MASDAQLLGRVTYEGFAKAWPKMEGAGEFGIKMNEMPKFVVSSTIENPNWNNSTVIGGDLGAEVTRLKEQFAGDLLVAGSAQLVNGLIARGLVDELHLIGVSGGARRREAPLRRRTPSWPRSASSSSTPARRRRAPHAGAEAMRFVTLQRRLGSHR